jgi:hypothetical protein
MSKEIWQEIATAFDKGNFSERTEHFLEQADGDPALTSHINKLVQVEAELKKRPEIAAPSKLIATVLGRLPDKIEEMPAFKPFGLRDLLVVALTVVTLLLVTFTARTTGLDKAFNWINGLIANSNVDFALLLFISLTAVGILFSAWLAVNSFTRIQRH